MTNLYQERTTHLSTCTSVRAIRLHFGLGVDGVDVGAAVVEPLPVGGRRCRETG